MGEVWSVPENCLHEVPTGSKGMHLGSRQVDGGYPPSSSIKDAQSPSRTPPPPAKTKPIVRFCRGGRMSCCGGMCPGLGEEQTSTTAQTVIMGSAGADSKREFEETGTGSENGCKCGSNCTCDPCNCK